MTFDSKIGWALVVALFVQSGTGFLWAGRMSARIESVEQRLAIAEPTAARLAALEAQLTDVQSSINRIERELETRR